MSEIVLAEPIHFEQGESSNARQNHHEYEFDESMAITTNSVTSSINGDYAEQLQPGPFDSERLPTVFASEIQRFLRVANLIEKEEPRVAYLCKSFVDSLFFFLIRFKMAFVSFQIITIVLPFCVENYLGCNSNSNLQAAFTRL